MRILFVAFLFSASSIFGQIKLNPEYAYYKDGKEISYNKGRKFLQSGGYIADISDENQTVIIREPSKLDRGMAFPFELMTDLEGNTIKPEDLKGKIVVINYWFTGCRPCIMEIPELNEVVESFKDDQIVFLAFANEIAPKVRSFLSKHPFDYRIIPGQMTNTLDKGITIFPTHIFVNRDGIIEDRFTGYSEGVGEKMSSKIQKML
jgi:thiol-disulfide isomerase/thioredoxin